MRGKTLIIFLLSLSFEAGAQAPASLDGPAKIIDGDTLDIAGQRIRLYGIDAPESRQTCTRSGQAYACGKEATAYMRGLIGNHPVQCLPRDQDCYGRVIAVCFDKDGTDLNRAMVQAGQAIAYRRYASDYIPDEITARAAQRGLWSGKFTPPWQWRKEQQ